MARRTAIITIVLCAALLATAPPSSLAADSSPKDWCYEFGLSGEREKQVEACSRDIDLGRYTGFALATRYANRANARHVLGNLDAAFNDYVRAFNLSPKMEYAGLGMVVAAADRPSGGREEALRLLLDFVAKNPSGEWARSISRFYLGQISEEALLTEARAGVDEARINQRLCEAFYYLGEFRAWLGDRDGAVNFFDRAVASGRTELQEHALAKARAAAFTKVP